MTFPPSARPARAFRCAALSAAASLLGVSASAQKPQAPSALEIGADLIVESRLVADGTMEVDARSGAPTALYHAGYRVQPAAPEAMGREFLAAHAALLRLASPSLDDLAFRVATEGPAGWAARFTQTVGGVPVLGPDVVVNVAPDYTVPFALLGYRAGLAVETTAPVVSAEAARAAAFAHLGVAGDLQFDETTLVVVPTADGARLAWRVRVVPAEPRGDWEALVDARTGELFRVADRAVYHRRGGAAMPDTVLATATVFHPDPLTRAGVLYGGQYVDGNDADTGALTAARTAVTFWVSESGSNYILENEWTAAREFEAPNKGTFPQPTPAWEFTRNPDAFEAATTYFHIDRMMRYVNDTLGVEARPYQSGRNGRAEFDAHALSGADNSYYSSGTGRVAFGEGCVDDDEDADVIVHELGHGLHDWLTVGGLSNNDGLSEGLGDYFAASYTRHLGLLEPTDAAYNWVFKWDGHNACWPGRTVNFAGTYPSGSAPHARGQHWGTANMRIWDDIGGRETDLAVVEGIRMTHGATTQPQAAQAVLQAARNMSYPQASLDAMFARYTAKGYNVTMPPPSTVGEAGPGVSGVLALGLPSPSPFRDRTTVTLRAGKAGPVRVELYDVLGRHVRTLFDGVLAAGEARALGVEAAGLAAGLYVVRATSDGAAASRVIVRAE